jgi:hypothetical protein
MLSRGSKFKIRMPMPVNLSGKARACALLCRHDARRDGGRVVDKVFFDEATSRWLLARGRERDPVFVHRFPVHHGHEHISVH